MTGMRRKENMFTADSLVLGGVTYGGRFLVHVLLEWL